MVALHRIRIENPEIPLENASSLLDSIRLTFVMGCPRSGTTFLLRCLSQLPRTSAHAGILVPDRLCHVIASGDAPAGLVDDILYSCRSVLWKTFVTSILSRRYHLAQARGGLRDAWRSARILLGMDEVPLRDFELVYKEPFLAMAAEAFAGHFPRARFVHLIRDGRDCANSMERTYGMALADEILDARGTRWREVGSEIGVGREHSGRIVPWWVGPLDRPRFLDASRRERYLWLWRECVSRARAASKIAGTRYLEMRYEGLCRNPRESGERLLDFLETGGSRRFWKRLGSARTSSIGSGSQRTDDASAPSWQPITDLLRELGYV